MKTALELLDALDEFFSSGNRIEREMLWDILTALRGPDLEDQLLKRHITVPIRRVALPKTAAIHDAGGLCIPAQFTGSSGLIMVSGRGHFRAHCRAAIVALHHVRKAVKEPAPGSHEDA